MNLLEYKQKCKGAVYFLSCYLHGDCIDEHGSAENVVASFIDHENLENIVSVADDFAYILEQEMSEEILETLLIELGADYYLWRTDDLVPSKWLGTLVNRFYEKAYC